jgi:hypothetical protein
MMRVRSAFALVLFRIAAVRGKYRQRETHSVAVAEALSFAVDHIQLEKETKKETLLKKDSASMLFKALKTIKPGTLCRRTSMFYLSSPSADALTPFFAEKFHTEDHRSYKEGRLWGAKGFDAPPPERIVVFKQLSCYCEETSNLVRRYGLSQHLGSRTVSLPMLLALVASLPFREISAFCRLICAMLDTLSCVRSWLNGVRRTRSSAAISVFSGHSRHREYVSRWWS